MKKSFSKRVIKEPKFEEVIPLELPEVVEGVVEVAEEKIIEEITIKESPKVKKDKVTPSKTISTDVYITPQAESVKKEVRVKTKRDHKCNVGGQWYYFTANRVSSVPEQVRNILLKSGMLLPL